MSLYNTILGIKNKIYASYSNHVYHIYKRHSIIGQFCLNLTCNKHHILTNRVKRLRLMTLGKILRTFVAVNEQSTLPQNLFILLKTEHHNTLENVLVIYLFGCLINPLLSGRLFFPYIFEESIHQLRGHRCTFIV